MIAIGNYGLFRDFSGLSQVYRASPPASRPSRIDEIDRAEMKIRNHEWRRAPNALHRSDRPLCAIGVADRFLVPLASFFPFAQAGMPQQAISAMHMNVVPACKRVR